MARPDIFRSSLITVAIASAFAASPAAARDDTLALTAVSALMR